MRIAFVNQPWETSSPPFPNGSLAIWNHQVAHRFAREHGCDVIVYEQPREGAPREERIDGVTYCRVRTRRVDLWVGRALRRIGRLRPPQRGYFAHPLHYRDYVTRVARDLRTRNCDVVHVHNFSQFVAPIRTANPRATVVLHMHCDWLSQLDQAVMGPRLARCGLIIGCSEHVTNGVRRRFPQFVAKCVTLYNAADLERFTPAPRAPGCAGAGRRLLYCGRVSPEKGIHDLLDAFARVLTAHTDVQLEILGGHGAAPREYMVAISTDPNVRALERFYTVGADYTAELKRRMTPEVAARTTFTNFLPQSEVAERIRTADLLAQPSLTDACPLPVGEAMACGLPVVGSRVGGIPELVEDGVTGLLTEPANPAELAEAIQRLLSDDALRTAMGRRARERAERLFSWGGVVETLSRSYRRAMLEPEHPRPAGELPPRVAVSPR